MLSIEVDLPMLLLVQLSWKLRLVTVITSMQLITRFSLSGSWLYFGTSASQFST